MSGVNKQIKFLSTLSLRRATHSFADTLATLQFLSTLSLRRATALRFWAVVALWHFYPRSPCGERRRRHQDGHYSQDFYPRSPCGERRSLAVGSLPPASNFYPRSPCGERQLRCVPVGVFFCISIHALLAESDGHYREGRRPRSSFLSTLSLRRATRTSAMSFCRRKNFYPRSPCGERLCECSG